MRLVVTCQVERAVGIPTNHQHLLTGIAYRFLACSDEEYARFLHDEGYAPDSGPKRFKLFCFSGLRAKRRRIAGETLWLGPGEVEWHIGSPKDEFLRNFATGLLAQGELAVGTQRLPIVRAQALPTPDFSSGTAHFSCLTPIVASVPTEGGGKTYLRPSEGAAFSEAARGNLLRKYRALHGEAPKTGEDNFTLTFDAEYLARNPHAGTKKITFKATEIIGALAPFTVVTSAPELIALGHAAGFGELNAGGFGMVETREPGRRELNK